MHRPMSTILVLLASCTVPPTAVAPATLRTWGTLREALRDGQTQARVDLAAVMSPQLVAVGAAAGLDGEVTIVDGTCYTSRVRDGRIRTDHAAAGAATILFAARVASWRSIRIPADVAAEDLAGFVARSARQVGIDAQAPFPFVIAGDLLAVDLHVLDGECPIRARMLGVTLQSPPAERRFDRTRGTLVGIHAANGGGVITHHGSALHVHAVVADPEPFTGHCESVGVAAGAVLRLPVGWQGG